jgi:deoxyribodipyrimidine photo-lyase
LSLGARRWLARHWLDSGPMDAARVAEGEQYLFSNLLDGSRAVNRSAWQEAAANVTGTTSVLSRWQVEQLAPGLCASCQLVNTCPVDHEIPGVAEMAAAPSPKAAEPVPGTAAEPVPGTDHLASTPQPRLPAGTLPPEWAGPTAPVYASGARPEMVWVTAESMGDADPALAAHPDLPAVFVFDEPLLARLRLAPRRLVFLTETLADLGTRRPVEVWLGRPEHVLASRPLAVTFTPVPGWHHRAARLPLAAVYPWPWLDRGDSRGESDSLSRPIDSLVAKATESSTGRNIGALV